MFRNIPEELKQFNSWIVWRYEQTADQEKPTKKPYNAVTGTLADPTDAATWCSFEQALYVFENTGYYSGIGFVLSDADPFAFIDLDATDNAEQIALQGQIYESFQSYAEHSPSGKGLHIICKGSLPKGKRKGSIELYTNQRYMTMTGNVYRNAPIVDCQETLISLWQHLGGTDEPEPVAIDQAASGEDAEVIRKAASASNAAKFIDLFNGNWQGMYHSQSEADFALVDIIAFYTDNKEQVTRIFRQSELGKREKAQRKDYVNYMVKKSFDRKLPPVDHSALTAKIEQAIEDKASYEKPKRGRPKTSYKEERPDPYTPPPGLVGRIAQFIHDAAPRPVPEIALAGAIGLMAGLAGRAYNISGTGLNQYVLLLARTGTGKEAIGGGISSLISEVKKFAPTASEFVGPSVIASPQALLKKLAKNRSFVSIIGEFGLKLQQMTGRAATAADKGVMTAMLDLFNKSGNGSIMGGMAYSDSDKDVAGIEAPAFSIIGESTPESFFAGIDETSIRSGLVPRFTVIEYKGDRPNLNEGRINVTQAMDLVDSLSKFVGQCAMLNHQNQTIVVQLDTEAESMFKQYNVFVDNQIRGKEDVSREIWNRAHIKALKMAALLAVGCNMFNPVITAELANWAINVENYNVDMLLQRFNSGEVGAGADTSESKQYKEVRRIIKEWLVLPWDKLERYKAGTIEMFNSKVVPYKYIQMRLFTLAAFRDDKRGATTAIQRTIQLMCDHGDLRMTTNQTLYNSGAKVLMVMNVEAFLV